MPLSLALLAPRYNCSRGFFQPLEPILLGYQDQSVLLHSLSPDYYLVSQSAFDCELVIAEKGNIDITNRPSERVMIPIRVWSIVSAYVPYTLYVQITF
jgi:hypothetical protein